MHRDNRAALLAATVLIALCGCSGAGHSAPEEQDMIDRVGVPPGLEDAVAIARADLEERSGTTGAVLIEARRVTWRDASAGCREPGMAYAQVLTPGVLLEFETAGRTWRYHGKRNAPPRYCARPDQDAEAPGSPDA